MIKWNICLFTGSINFPVLNFLPKKTHFFSHNFIFVWQDLCFTGKKIQKIYEKNN